MNLPLANARARAVLLVCCSALALLLGFFAVRNAIAAHYLGRDTREGYERAVRLEPHNPRNWYLLGRSYLYDLEQPDPVKAVSALRKSVELDPYSAEAMLDLAIAYDGEGDTAAARAALVSAQRVYPLSADVAWSYGNFLLRQGEQEAAFTLLHTALELDPKRAAEAFSRALQLQPDSNVVLDRVVPATPATYLPILRMLSDAGDMETAQQIWVRLVGLHQKVPLREVVPFFEALTHMRRPDQGAQLWPQAVAIMENPPPADPASSMLWDGGFESGFRGGGFSWRFTPVSRDVQISFDRAEKHSGEQSLRILFNGRENLNFEDACHQFVPDPGKSYLLTGWVKTQSLTSSEGVRLQVGAFTKAGVVSVQSGEIHGTQPWTQLQLAWTAPQDAGLGSVCVRRKMSDMPGSDIQGAVWIDDVVMIPAGAPATAVAAQP
jgi:tetratricopeptide (TPR) repeat protein